MALSDCFRFPTLLGTARRRPPPDAIVDEGSIQNTNSWGLRGPEPDPTAQARGIVLGDSFMQGMFNGDDDTPPLYLERCLREAWKMPVSVLNTGHIGYSPEQYYYSLKEYGDRFRPSSSSSAFVPTTSATAGPCLRGEGDWYGEAGYWLDQIHGWCRSPERPLPARCRSHAHPGREHSSR